MSLHRSPLTNTGNLATDNDQFEILHAGGDGCEESTEPDVLVGDFLSDLILYVTRDDDVSDISEVKTRASESPAVRYVEDMLIDISMETFGVDTVEELSELIDNHCMYSMPLSVFIRKMCASPSFKFIRRETYDDLREVAAAISKSKNFDFEGMFASPLTSSDDDDDDDTSSEDEENDEDDQTISDSNEGDEDSDYECTEDSSSMETQTMSSSIGNNLFTRGGGYKKNVRAIDTEMIRFTISLLTIWASGVVTGFALCKLYWSSH